MRLIDADAYKKYLDDNWIVANYNAIDAQPTIDAVEVVRCKDCVNRPSKIRNDKESNGFNLTAREKDFFEYYCPFMCEDGWYSTIPPDDFYCKNGERKTDETD